MPTDRKTGLLLGIRIIILILFFVFITCLLSKSFTTPLSFILSLIELRRTPACDKKLQKANQSVANP